LLHFWSLHLSKRKWPLLDSQNVLLGGRLGLSADYQLVGVWVKKSDFPKGIDVMGRRALQQTMDDQPRLEEPTALGC
jgi:hypothetical protein